MIAKSYKVLVPVLVWVVLCSGLFMAAVYQQRLGHSILPFVTMSNVFSWVATAVLAYMIVVWPISLERMVERFARTAAGQNSDYYVMSVQEPGLLMLYVAPVLVAAAAFGDKGLSEMLQVAGLVVAVGIVVQAYFSLGFFVHGNLARPFFLVIGLICVVAPLANVVLEALHGSAPTFMSYLNPFSAVFAIAESGGSVGAAFLIPASLYTVAGLVMIAFPLLAALPPRFFDDIPWG